MSGALVFGTGNASISVRRRLYGFTTDIRGKRQTSVDTGYCLLAPLI